LSESEILENEKMWKQENPIDGPSGPGGDNEDFSDLGSVGVMGGGDGSLDDFEADDFDGEEEEFDGDEGESPVSGAEAGEDDGEEL
jgi:hypothetical protein